MTYRSFTSLATRKSPTFRGKSLRLDGVSDFIDMQGEHALAFRNTGRRAQTTNTTIQSPCSWDFWVRFDNSTKSDIIASTALGNDMNYFIMKMYAAKTSDNPGQAGSGYYCGMFCGLVADANGDLKVASGFGKSGTPSVGQRVIRSGNTTIEIDRWYHIVVTYTVYTEPNIGLNIFVNGVDQTLSAVYPVGTTTGELNPITQGPGGARFYYYPYAPTDDTHPGGYAGTSHRVNYLGNAEHTYAVALGRNQDSYLAMDIHRCGFWATTQLDVDDAVGLYRNGTNVDYLSNPMYVNYHVNQGTGTGQYDKGEDEHATATIKFISVYNNSRISLTDLQGVTKTYSISTDGAWITDANGVVRSDGDIQVITSSGGTFSTTIAHTNFSAAINTNQPGITATNAAANAHVILTQTAGGDHGNTLIDYPDFPGTTGTGATFCLLSSGFISDSTGAEAPKVFTGGHDRLHGTWRFQGPKVSDSLDSTLQSTSNRLSEFNEDITNGDRKQNFYLYGSNAYPVTGVTPFNESSWHYSTQYTPFITKSALNNGGTWINDTPTRYIP